MLTWWASWPCWPSSCYLIAFLGAILSILPEIFHYWVVPLALTRLSCLSILEHLFTLFGSYMSHGHKSSWILTRILDRCNLRLYCTQVGKATVSPRTHCSPTLPTCSLIALKHKSFCVLGTSSLHDCRCSESVSREIWTSTSGIPRARNTDPEFSLWWLPFNLNFIGEIPELPPVCQQQWNRSRFCWFMVHI